MKTFVQGICLLGCYGCIAVAALRYDYKCAVLMGIAMIMMGVALGVE